jgi:quinol monooxygenase YgiN
MPVIVVATVIPIPEHRADVVAAFERAIATVHAEDEGCELYALHEGEERLVMVEKWATSQSLSAHGQTPAMQEFVEAINGKIVGKLDVQILTPHPAGNPEQGEL